VGECVCTPMRTPVGVTHRSLKFFTLHFHTAFTLRFHTLSRCAYTHFHVALSHDFHIARDDNHVPMPG